MAQVVSGGVDTMDFEYDGLHRRIQKVDNGSSTTGYYYNEQWQCILESEGTGGSEAAKVVYIWRPHYVDALAVRMRADEDDEHFFTHDANFNVTAAVEEATGDPMVERYAYTPYGEATYLEENYDVATAQVSAIGNEHLYTGRRTDPETGLQLNRYRYYHQQLGR
ncbi:MAG: hypothetical protein KDA37_08055, partial [Planctomycetales bacterium]|nr:hypothetical protein [Planctomycetales bacterium]